MSMQVIKSQFVRQEIRLDFMSYRECIFNDCVMVYGGYGPISLTNCEFRNVRWVFTDAANNTLKFLAALYHSDGGGREVANFFLKQVTGNGGPSPKLPEVDFQTIALQS